MEATAHVQAAPLMTCLSAASSLEPLGVLAGGNAGLVAGHMQAGQDGFCDKPCVDKGGQNNRLCGAVAGTARVSAACMPVCLHAPHALCPCSEHPPFRCRQGAVRALPRRT